MDWYCGNCAGAFVFVFLLNLGGDMRKQSDYIAMIEDEDQEKAVKKILKTEGKST